MKIWFQLYYEFFKTGLFSIGGGLATLPFLYEMGIKTGWFTGSDIADMVAVSETTPGPLGINMATYVGFKSVGIFGGLVAALGLITPSILVILIIAKILNKFRTSILIQRIFYGLRPASTALIASAGLNVAGIALLNFGAYRENSNILDLFSWKCIILALIIFIAYKKFKVHPIIYIAASAVIGIMFQL